MINYCHSKLRKIPEAHRCFIHKFCKLIKNLLTVIADKIAENMTRSKHASFVVVVVAVVNLLLLLLLLLLLRLNPYGLLHSQF